jgi:hypothetical protein
MRSVLAADFFLSCVEEHHQSPTRGNNFGKKLKDLSIPIAYILTD